ncbi:MAG: hypothetical protein EXS14_04550 [Planctomycetes bacterium]|nr:hypothetical protein [Planctomycetota bacterium]
MSVHSAQRGAVSLLVLILVLVVTLIFGALWFTQMTANEELTKNAEVAAKGNKAATAQMEFYRDYYAAVAPLVGGGVPSTIPYDSTTTDPGALVAEGVVKIVTTVLEGVGQQVDAPSERPASLVAALDVPITRVKALKGQLAAKDQEIVRLKSEGEAQVTQISQLGTAHADEKARMQSEFESNISRLNSQINEVRAQNEAVQGNVRTSQTELESSRENFNKEKQGLLAERKDMESTVRSVKSEQRIKRATVTADGKVLSADPKTGTVFIDITSKNMLRRGTRFKVFETGKGGERIHKGYVTVTDVGAAMSEARMDESAGNGQMGAGDWLYSPIFEAKETVTFAFLGQLPGRYSREIASRMLANAGAKIGDKVDVSTTFLVLGEKEDADAEELTASADYKNALLWGVEILRSQDLSPFLKQ